jgi:hypothetical protein
MNRSQLTLAARLHAEKRSRSEESQALGAMQEALATAHESIVRLVLERDSELRMRLDAESKVQSERRGREAAMRGLQQAMQAVRKFKTQAAERQREAAAFKAWAEAEQHAHEESVRQLRDLQSTAEEHVVALARLEARCRKMAMQLKELEDALVQAEYLAYRQSMEQADLQAELQNERRARVAAQNEACKQQTPGEAPHGLSGSASSRVWNKLRLTQR